MQSDSTPQVDTRLLQSRFEGLYKFVMDMHWRVLALEGHSILLEWRDEAHRVIERGANSDEQIARLNKIAMRYADKTGKTVPLVGREAYEPETAGWKFDQEAQR